MNKLVCAAALVAASTVFNCAALFAHGGTYAGPGDTVPPGGGGSGGGGGSTGGSGGPNTPNGPGPTTPNGPGVPGMPTGGGGGAGGSPTGGGADAGLDLTRWQFWWELNREPYLDLKRRIWEGAVVTGSDESYFSGERRAVRDALRPSRERVAALVVPALIAALERETAGNDVLTGAMIALAKIGDVRDESGTSPFARRFAQLLLHPNQEVAETAAIALGILGDEDELELLAALLADDRAALETAGVQIVTSVPERTRAFAAYALGMLAEHASADSSRMIAAALAKPLADGGRGFARRDVPVACVLAMGLVELDQAPLEAPCAAPFVYEPGRFQIAEHQLRWLLELFADRRNPALVRAHVPRSLARIASAFDERETLRAEVVAALLAGLEAKPAEDPAVQQSCVLALGQLADCDADEFDSRVRASLGRVLTDAADVQVKRFALIALAQVAGRAGQGDDPLAGLSAKKGGPRGLLLERLSKGQSNERCWAALALGVLERALDDQRLPVSSDAVTSLRFALSEAKSPDEIGACAIALGLVRDHLATESLLERFARTSDPDARGYVALALGLIGDNAAIAPIQEVVAKSKYQPDLLRSAATALGLLGDRNVCTTLIEMLDTASALSSQAAIASALGFIGDARSLDPLVAMLADQAKTDRSRGFAAAALGIVADQDAHAWVSRLSLGINYRASTETLTAPDGGTGILQLL